VIKPNNQAAQLSAFSKFGIDNILNTIDCGFLVLEQDGTIAFANKAAADMFLYQEEELIGLHFNVLLKINYCEKYEFYFKHYQKTGENPFVSTSKKIDAVTKYGYAFPIAHTFVELKNNNDIFLAVSIQDLSEIKAQQKFLETVIENMPNMVFVKDAKSLKYTLFNRAGEQLLGMPRNMILGKSDHELFPAEQANAFVQKDKQVLQQHEASDIPEEPIQTSFNSTRYLHTRKMCIRDRRGNPQYLLGISEDVTEKKRLTEELIRQSNEDQLTKLANRHALKAFVKHETKRAQRINSKLGVVYMDLNKFKPINDTYGHQAGDDVLVAFSNRLKGFARETDCVARIGGDEFVVVLTDIHNKSQVDCFCQRVKQSFRQEIETEFGNFEISASIGISLYPDDGESIEQLLQRADHAMYTAKNSSPR